MVNQPSLLTALEPIDPREFVERVPGIDAPCICDPERRNSCLWPWCNWKAATDERP